MSKHKDRQLCRQVQRALNLALAYQLYVVDVTSELGCGHLLVHVAVPDGMSMPDALSSLRREAPRLRAQVAGAISRKRAPELTFIPIMYAGGGDG